MKKVTLIIGALAGALASYGQILTQATTPQSITGQVPGLSQVTSVNTASFSYTPPAPPSAPTPVDGDTTTEDDGAYQYGSPLTVNLSMANGNYTSTSAGKVWTLRISIPSALNIGLVFSQFNLAANAEMYICNDAQTVLKYKSAKQILQLPIRWQFPPSTEAQ